MDKTFNITIVSGCLALQNKLKEGRVEEENVYHQIIKREVKDKYELEVNIKIIYYERYSDCFDKITNSLAESPADLLIFQVRGYHYLRLIKFVGKYVNDQKKWKWNLNFPLFDLGNYEKFPPEWQYFQPQRNLVKSYFKAHHSLKGLYQLIKDINYLIGVVVGNVSYARKRYIALIENIINLSKNSDLPLIFIGVVSRPGFKIENSLSKGLNEYILDFLASSQLPYLNIFGNYDPYGEYKFESDQLHLNNKGHREIAEKLLFEISKFHLLEMAEKT